MAPRRTLFPLSSDTNHSATPTSSTHPALVYVSGRVGVCVRLPADESYRRVRVLFHVARGRDRAFEGSSFGRTSMAFPVAYRLPFASLAKICQLPGIAQSRLPGQNQGAVEIHQVEVVKAKAKVKKRRIKHSTLVLWFSRGRILVALSPRCSHGQGGVGVGWLAGPMNQARFRFEAFTDVSL